ncbi:MAG: hypothetical protein KAI34_02480, partial [Candidatus Lokiarchaeota archaeon]|nr:hypothetical protein [Candidatus Lokiarchaeota archaeon]
AREKEGPVIIPPQIDGSYYNFLHENKSAGELGVLLKEYEKYDELTKENPGEIVEGRIFLGAPPQYYNPSEEEKRLSEIGRCIRELIRNSKNKESIIKMTKSVLKHEAYVDDVEYYLFNFYHVDVVGTGRFFYPSDSITISFSIIEMICDIAANVLTEQELEQIKNCECNNKEETKKCFEKVLNFLRK